MQCPYCSHQMQPCGSVSYAGLGGVRVVDWVRCVHCQHATPGRIRTVKTPQQPLRAA
jgi:hypothetical protein